MKFSIPGAISIEFGRFEADPIPTDFGRVKIDALGCVCKAPWGALRVLRPHSATVHRPDGRIVHAPIGDLTGRATFALVAAGVVVTLITHRFRVRKE